MKKKKKHSGVAYKERKGAPRLKERRVAPKDRRQRAARPRLGGKKSLANRTMMSNNVPRPRRNLCQPRAKRPPKEHRWWCTDRESPRCEKKKTDRAAHSRVWVPRSHRRCERVKTWEISKKHNYMAVAGARESREQPDDLWSPWVNNGKEKESRFPTNCSISCIHYGSAARGWYSQKIVFPS